MSISVEDFLKENPIKTKSKSKLTRYKDDIRRLREAGATYAKITEFLKENGVSVSWLTVRQFVINHLSEKQKAPQSENLTNETESHEPLEPVYPQAFNFYSVKLKY